jgi:hypothetical protein
MFMGHRVLVWIASALLLGPCWAAAGSHAEDALIGPQAAVQQAEFEDTAVATLNSKVDAAAQAAPAPQPPLPAAAEAQPAASDGTALPPEAAADRKSRLAALKARLHQHMGAEADPPAEEPPLPPPPGPTIGLRQPQALQNMGVSISGWVQQGITLNDEHPASRFNGPVALNDRDGEYQMNQCWMTLQRPVNTGGDGFDFGGRIDAAYGTDWRWEINNGLEDRINGLDGQTYGMMLPQAYAAVGFDDLTVKLGHFEAILDYESLPAQANFFYSHSYCYTYGVPHQVTGMLAEYKMDENWSIQGGIDRGWNQFEDDNQSLDFLGGFRWQSSDRRTMVSYSLSNGPQDVGSAENRFVYSLVIQEKLGPRSEYVLVHDLGVESNAAPDGGLADWYGLNQYYIYTLSSQWAACLRGEWFRDQDGAAVVGPGNVPGVRAWAGHGFAGNFYELTAGLNWRPQANVIFRPEVRYDWYDGGAGGYGLANQTGLPFNDGRSSTQFLTAADLILLF